MIGRSRLRDHDFRLLLFLRQEFLGDAPAGTWTSLVRPLVALAEALIA